MQTLLQAFFVLTFAEETSLVVCASCPRGTKGKVQPYKYTCCCLQDPEMPLWLSDHAQDFLNKTLLKDPAKRSSAAQLLKHPWLKSLGFKQPVDQVASSIEVVEPTLPPRPVMQPESQLVVIAEPVLADDDEALLEEAVKAEVPEETGVTATGVYSIPFLPLTLEVLDLLEAASLCVLCVNFLQS